MSAFVVGSVFPDVPTFSVRFPEESSNGAGDPSDFQRIDGEEGYSIERSSAVPTAVVEADRGVFGKKKEILDQDPLSDLGTILGREHGQRKSSTLPGLLRTTGSDRRLLEGGGVSGCVELRRSGGEGHGGGGKGAARVRVQERGMGCGDSPLRGQVR